MSRVGPLENGKEALHPASVAQMVARQYAALVGALAERQWSRVRMLLDTPLPGRERPWRLDLQAILTDTRALAAQREGARGRLRQRLSPFGSGPPPGTRTEPDTTYLTKYAKPAESFAEELGVPEEEMPF